MYVARKQRANVGAAVWGIVGLVGTVVGILSLLVTVYNWSSVLKADFEFPKNASSVLSEWYNIGGTHEAAAWQTAGTSSCKYSCHRYTRTQSGYNTVFTGKTFSENNALDGVAYTITFPAINDTRFKVNKTAGTSVASTMVLGIGDP